MNGHNEESPDEDRRLLAMSLQKTSLTNSIQHKQTPDREQEVEDVKEKRPARRSTERHERPEEGHDITEIKGNKEEQKTPLENKVG